MSFETVKKIVKALDDKKGNDIKVMQVNDLTIVADYFVLVTANSGTHVRALGEEVEFQLEEAGMAADHIEGRATGWVLLEYDGVIVHIFDKESRSFYNLENLWKDATEIDVSDFIE